MKPISVKEVDDWRKVTINGIPMLFTDYRINRSTVPAGIHAYDIRAGDDSENDFATLELCVMANHTGTVLAKRRIPMPDGYLQIADYGLEDDTTLDEWLNSRNE